MQKTSSGISPFCRFVCLLALAAMLVSLLPPPAARALQDTLWLETQYDSPGSATPRTWRFPYRDELFAGDGLAYDHTLARASLGMALSAFRSKHIARVRQDDTVRAYMTDAGFMELASEDYDKTPTAQTVSTMIGRKAMDGFTLVAVAVCGGGYGDEWMSNFTIGDGERHEGFDAAAEKVQARVRAYLTARGIEGPIKLWISGYSRAAAVTNLAAAGLTDSGLFDAVFAYAFATPRTTKSPGAYPNIFNIIGKFDPVSMVPMPEWGYGRNGVELFTPAQETDTDYPARKAAADDVSRQLTGGAFFNNTEMNATIHMILDFLLAIVPDSATYAEHMQDIMLSVWRNRSVDNLSASIVRMMQDEKLLSGSRKHEMEYLLDYLSLVTYSTVAGGASWNRQTTMLDNLAHEHSPDVYVCWLFSSDDPARVYTDADSYMRVTWSGSATVSLFDTEGRFVYSIDGTGRVSDIADDPVWNAFTQPVDERPLIASLFKNGRTVVTLPRDGNYLLYITDAMDEEMYYYGAEYSVRFIRAAVDKMTELDLQKDEEYIIISLRDEDADGGPHLLGSESDTFNIWDEQLPYSPSVMAMIENEYVFHLSFGQMAMLAGGLTVLVVGLLVWLIVHLARKRGRARRLASGAAARPEG